MDSHQYPDFIEDLMSFIRNKEVSKFFNFLTEKSLEHSQFVDSAFDDKCTLLMSASYHGQKDIVQKLLDIGCNINLKNDSLWTALMFAAYSGHDDIVKMLLEKHADIDTVNSLGSTALHLATCMGHTNVFRVLLKENANIHIKDNAGWTVGLIAKKKGFRGIVQLMADYERIPSQMISGQISQTIVLSSDNNIL
ncbi:ankyrin repeat domain-containing protein 29-like [Physella acuta]|uniref:ankyrin repeat domain-containing protein 29-like n=1 Tax=Physella acuta TaxID=109671 RepID=UPI0027DE25D7|nr:ankyrin repeat domain-containing protein 29-like [Physella acuta]